MSFVSLYFFKYLKQGISNSRHSKIWGRDGWMKTKLLWKRLYLIDLSISQHLTQITLSFCWINKRINHEHWFEPTNNLRLSKGCNILTFSNFPLHEKTSHQIANMLTCRHFSMSFPTMLWEREHKQGRQQGGWLEASILIQWDLFKKLFCTLRLQVRFFGGVA